MGTLRIIPLSILCVLISVTTWAAPPTYRIIQVSENPGVDALKAAGLNNRGDVVFFQGGVVCCDSFFFNYRSGAINHLTFDALPFAIVRDISDNGLIVGSAFNFFGPQVPVLWSTIGGVEALPCRLQCSPNAVNNRGLIVGAEGMFALLGSEAVTWSGPQHTLASLPMLRCDTCNVHIAVDNTALAVNNRGHIVGSSNFSYPNIPPTPGYNAGVHAVEWQNGHVTDLGGLNGSNDSAATGINDKDDIVGESTVGRNGLLHAFLYHQGKMLDLGTLEGDTESSAASINNLGEIVGSSGSRAFIYTNGQMYDLNGLIDPISPLGGVISLYEAVAINSAGWIAANGLRTFNEGFDILATYLLIPNATP
jgi:probable HAF family extracellular repeat protein